MLFIKLSLLHTYTNALVYEGYFRLAEALCFAGYLQEALHNYSESYSRENNIITYCKYFITAVQIGR